MPDNEIRDAAERLRADRYDDRAVAGVWRVELLGASPQQIADWRTLALDRLAQQDAAAELDKPITREWLTEVLGKEPSDTPAVIWHKMHKHAFPHIRWFSGLRSFEGRFAGGYAPLKTKADVLAFCRLCRWPVKGGDDASV